MVRRGSNNTPNNLGESQSNNFEKNAADMVASQDILSKDRSTNKYPLSNSTSTKTDYKGAKMKSQLFRD